MTKNPSAEDLESHLAAQSRRMSELAQRQTESLVATEQRIAEKVRSGGTGGDGMKVAEQISPKIRGKSPTEKKNRGKLTGDGELRNYFFNLY